MNDLGTDMKSILRDALNLLDEKDKLILSQEKDIGCLKNEISQLKKERDCFQSEKEQ